MLLANNLLANKLQGVNNISSIKAYPLVASGIDLYVYYAIKVKVDLNVLLSVILY